MKKILITFAILFAFASLAAAAPLAVQCTPTNVNPITNQGVTPVNVACGPINADVNNHFVNWTLTFLASWSDSLSATTLHSVLFTAAPTGFTPAADATCTATATSAVSFCFGSGAVVAFGNSTTTTFSLGNVTVSAANAGGQGVTLPDGAVVTVNLIGTQAPDAVGGVPEPMTMSLMGAGLLVLGLAGRKFRRS